MFDKKISFFLKVNFNKSNNNKSGKNKDANYNCDLKKTLK